MNSFDSRYLGGPDDASGPSERRPDPTIPPPVAAAGPIWPTTTHRDPGPARPRRGGRMVVAALAVAVLGGAAGAGGAFFLDRSSTTTTPASSGSTAVRTVASPRGTTTVADVVSKVDAEVVSLTVTGDRESDLGSGVVIRPDGLILTNNHVVAAAENGGTISVTFTDGTTAPATIVSADASEDLALVQARGVSGRSVATFGNSDSLEIGDTVIAIGNELGLPNSVSAGIVSALHRKVSVASDDSSSPFGQGGGTSTTYDDAIQTDAAINQGDSGGALFNTAGQVVGIDSAIATGSDSSTGSVGIGFAIASNDVTAFIAQATHT
jgi:putative serine protease PepD